MNKGTRNEYMSPYSPLPMAQAEYCVDMYLLRVPRKRSDDLVLAQTGDVVFADLQ